MAEPIKKPIDPGIVARVGQGLSYPPTISNSQQTVRGADPSVWFGPGQPLQPVAQDVAGRRWNYPVAMNIRIRPREDELVSFEQMIGLSYGYDLLRTVIETRKDQIVKVEWGIDPKDNKIKHDSRCDELENFLLFPDQEHTWQQWIRQLVEDMLVIDAATVYPRLTRGGLARRKAGNPLNPGDIFSLDCMDGATIKRIIDGSEVQAGDVAIALASNGLHSNGYGLARRVLLERFKAWGRGVIAPNDWSRQLLEEVAQQTLPKRRKERPSEVRRVRHRRLKYPPLRGSRAAARARDQATESS